MTWPFENDTNVIVKKLAAAQLKKEHLKKVFTMTAISLAAFLMCSVAQGHKGKFSKLRNISRRLESIPQQINCLSITGSL